MISPVMFIDRGLELRHISWGTWCPSLIQLIKWYFYRMRLQSLNVICKTINCRSYKSTEDLFIKLITLSSSKLYLYHHVSDTIEKCLIYDIRLTDLPMVHRHMLLFYLMVTVGIHNKLVFIHSNFLVNDPLNPVCMREFRCSCEWFMGKRWRLRIWAYRHCTTYWEVGEWVHPPITCKMQK